MSSSFICVFIPTEETRPMEEWRVAYDAGSMDDTVACLMNRLQQHFRDQDAHFSATAPAAEQQQELPLPRPQQQQQQHQQQPQTPTSRRRLRG